MVEVRADTLMPPYSPLSVVWDSLCVCMCVRSPLDHLPAKV